MTPGTSAALQGSPYSYEQLNKTNCTLLASKKKEEEEEKKTQIWVGREGRMEKLRMEGIGGS